MLRLTKTETLIAAVGLLGLVLMAAPAMAADEYNTSTGAALSGAPLALRGADPTALAGALTVAPGDAAYAYDHDGVAYYFASEAARERFAAEPSRYLPQYGGFCAFGVAIDRKLDADPHYADIVDGKLYLFLNAVAFGKYLDDKEGVLAKAEENWPAMHHLAVEEVNG